MAIWAQSLSWVLVYSLGQGVAIYLALWLALKMIPAGAANVRYHLSLVALTVLSGCFAGTWWAQYHAIQAIHVMVGNAQPLTLLPDSSAINIPNQFASTAFLQSALNIVLGWLPVLYVAGVVLMLIRLLMGSGQLLSLRKKGLSAPTDRIVHLLDVLKKQLNISGNVQIFLSAKATVPMVIGFLKPMILLPVAAIAQLSTEQLETILLHELAHIKRYDYLVNLLQTVVETILFFNPFAWTITAIIRREREHCCDDLVLDHTSEPLKYATALAVLANHAGTAATLAVAATGQHHHLFNRIKRITEMKKHPISYSRVAAAILIIAIITGSLVWVAPLMARTNKDKATTTANTSVAKPAAATAPTSEEIQLVRRLEDANLINEVKGFSITKTHDKLYINGALQTKEVAAKYLMNLKKDEINVQIMSFGERMVQHPGAGILQNLAPMTFSSPCVKTTARRDTC